MWQVLLWLVWLNLFNAEFVSERYWQGPLSQDAGEKEDNTYRYAVATRMTRSSCIKVGNDESRLKVFYFYFLKDKVTSQRPSTTTFEEREKEEEDVHFYSA